MILCTNHDCPRLWDCLRYRARPEPGEAATRYAAEMCEHFILDKRLDDCKGDECALKP